MYYLMYNIILYVVGRIIANDGPHISMYVADLTSCYRNAEMLGSLFVNSRFKRKAYTLDEAVDQCMFRCLEVIDPKNIDLGPILRLEHEVRSAVTADGNLYKSCPFFEKPLVLGEIDPIEARFYI